MAEISAKDVMALRNRTGLAMMECKKALAEAEGDFERAEEILRKKLKGKMDTRADRAAGEGRLAVAIAGDKAALVELRAETDFTAKNEKFVGATEKLAQFALASADGSLAGHAEAGAIVDDLRISTGENISIARTEKLTGGAFASYLHHDGKTAVLLQADGPGQGEALRQVCMHIAAAVPPPLGVTADDIPAAVVEKERRFRIEQAMESGKPQQIAEKIVEGGMRKFFEEIALLEQPFIMDASRTVKEIVGATKVKAFRRWKVGEQA